MKLRTLGSHRRRSREPYTSYPVDLDQNVSQFEKDLFLDGIYTYSDMDRYNAKGKGVSAFWDDRGLKEAKKSDPQNSELINELMAERDERISREEAQEAWRKYFSEKIPKNWGLGKNFKQIEGYIEEAFIQGVQLSNTLIGAIVTHDEWHVKYVAGTHQRVVGSQLAILLAQDLPQYSIRDIVNYQMSQGLNEDEINKALEIAKEIQDSMTDDIFNIDKLETHLLKDFEKHTLKGSLVGTVALKN